MLFYSVWQDPILVRWCFDFSNNSNGHEESVQVSIVRLLGIHQRVGHVPTSVSAWICYEAYSGTLSRRNFRRLKAI